MDNALTFTRFFTDYNYREEDLQDLLYKRIDSIGDLTRSKLYARLFISLRWYDFLRVIPPEQLPEVFSDDVLPYIWPQSMKEKFRYAGRILSS